MLKMRSVSISLHICMSLAIYNVYTLVIYGCKLSNVCLGKHYSVSCNICGHSVQVLQTSSSMGVGNFGTYLFYKFKDIFKLAKLHQIPRLESQATWKIVIKNLSLIAVKCSGCYACMDKCFHKVFSVGEFSLEFICFLCLSFWFKRVMVHLCDEPGK